MQEPRNSGVFCFPTIVLTFICNKGVHNGNTWIWNYLYGKIRTLEKQLKESGVLKEQA